MKRRTFIKAIFGVVASVYAPAVLLGDPVREVAKKVDSSFQDFPLSPDSPVYMIDHSAFWPDGVSTPTKEELIQKMGRALQKCRAQSTEYSFP